VRGWAEVMLSGREGTVGASDKPVVEGTVVDVDSVGTEGMGSMAAMLPARSQGFGGEPMILIS